MIMENLLIAKRLNLIIKIISIKKYLFYFCWIVILVYNIIKDLQTRIIAYSTSFYKTIVTDFSLGQL